MKTAVVYHTGEGHTAEIAERVAAVQREAGRDVDVFRVEEAPACLLGYGAVVLGGPIHVGKHGAPLVSYAKRHAADLTTVTSAFFSVSMAASGQGGGDRTEAEGYVQDFAEATGWHPDLVGMFGGALLYRRYGFVKRKLMQFIAKRKGAPTDASRDYDFTDWDAVEEFARDVARLADARGESQPAWD